MRHDDALTNCQPKPSPFRMVGVSLVGLPEDLEYLRANSHIDPWPFIADVDLKIAVLLVSRDGNLCSRRREFGSIPNKVHQHPGNPLDICPNKGKIRRYKDDEMMLSGDGLKLSSGCINNLTQVA